MKRITTLILCMAFILGIANSVSAVPANVVDNAGLLSDSERATLEAEAQRIAQEYNVDVVIVTTESLNGKASENYADDFYDNNGYGIGEDFSGILLLLSMEYRDWAISTTGEAIYAVTDYGVQDLFSQISGYLSQDQYFIAFSVYLDALETYLKAYRNGAPIDGFQHEYTGPGTFIPDTQDEIVYYEPLRDFSWYIQKIGISLVIGIVIAGIVLLILRGQMNTARAQRGADSYMLKDTYQVNVQRDIFLYSQLQKVRKSENSSGGGSSVHAGSSGRSHGGGHGKF